MAQPAQTVGVQKLEPCLAGAGEPAPRCLVRRRRCTPTSRDLDGLVEVAMWLSRSDERADDRAATTGIGEPSVLARRVDARALDVVGGTELPPPLPRGE